MKIVPLESSHIAAIAWQAIIEDRVTEEDEMVFWIQFKGGEWYEYRPKAFLPEADLSIAATVALITFAESPGTALNAIKDSLNYRRVPADEALEFGLNG